MVQAASHRICIYLGKVFLAGVIALAALTLFCMVYDNTPVYVACEDGVTDSKYAPDSVYCRMLEGFGYGRTNNDGYSDLFDFDSTAPLQVLLMGSSHMEAHQVPQRLSTASQLDALLTDDSVYSIGMTGHYLPVCADNLAAAVEKYAPSKYVIVETGSILFSRDSLEQVFDGTRVRAEPNTGRLYMLLRSNQYLHLVVTQMQHFLNIDTGGEDGSVPSADDVGDPALVSALLAQMADTAASSGAKLIIAYHPGITLERDGSITFSSTKEEENAFAGLCAENGAYFLNMRERFQREYDQDHILPYGFANTSVGTGHMNRYGHKMMAEELYALMQEVGL